MWFPALLAGVVTAAVVVGIPLLVADRAQHPQAVAGGAPGTRTSPDDSATAPANETATDSTSASAQAAPVDTDAQEPEQVSLVRFTADGGLTASTPGVQVLAQRRGIDLGANFASATDLTAVAKVDVQGTVWYVLARQVHGEADYVTTRSPALSLDAFLQEARQRYQDEIGYR